MREEPERALNIVFAVQLLVHKLEPEFALALRNLHAKVQVELDSDG